MSLLSRLFRVKSVFSERGREKAPSSRQVQKRFTDRDRSHVSSSLDRFTSCGLHIIPTLRRDLIIARALIELARSSDSYSLADEDTALETIDVRELFYVLAEETEGLFYYVEDIENMTPEVAGMPSQSLNHMLELHSRPIFENAKVIGIINESHYTEEMLSQIVSLAGYGDTIDEPEKYLRDFATAERPNIEGMLEKLNDEFKDKGRFFQTGFGRYADSFMFAFIANKYVLSFSELLLEPD